MVVISAFPGMGKTYYYENCQQIHSSYDSDSSKFDKSSFPQNYIEHIKQKLQDNDRDIIFVSSHKAVRDALKENRIRYVVVYPTIGIKNTIINRYRNRGSSESFVKLLEDNYDNWIKELMNETDAICIKKSKDLGDRLSVEIDDGNLYIKSIVNDIVEGGKYASNKFISYGFQSKEMQ